jgi:hypothetical protein
MPMDGPMPPVLPFLVLGALLLAAPAPALAHLTTGALARDFEARVEGLHPAVSDLGARVLAGDQRLELRAGPARTVVVLGVEGEPFLRFSRGGVEVNLASPTAASARVIAAKDAGSTSRAVWRRLTRGHVFAWHEGRLRPLPDVRGGETRPSRVGSWSIPLQVDGQRVSLVGGEWFAAAPPLWPWLLAGVLLLAAAGLGARVLSWTVRERVLSVLVPVAVAALLAGWLGIGLAGRVTLLPVLFAGVLVALVALCVIAALSAPRDVAQLGVLALIGATAAALALPEVPVFAHGFVVSALPAGAQRVAVATAIVAGAAAAILSVPAVITLLEGTPRPAPDGHGWS